MFLTKITLILGLAQGYHVMSVDQNKNDTHPYALVEKGQFGGGVYYNSFSRPSYTVYTRLKDGDFTLRYGFATGYKEGETSTHLNNGLSIILFPQYTFYKKDNFSTNVSMMGDSINFGFNFTF